MTKQHDLMPEESSAQNRSLVENLRQIYSISPEEARALDRIRGHLNAAERERNISERLMLAQALRERNEPGSMGIKVPSPPSRSGRRKKRVINLTAAILMITLLIGSLSVIVSLVRQNRVNSPVNVASTHAVQTPSRSGRVSPDLEEVHMFSQTAGWIEGSDGTILHTVDGGSSWQDVTPPQLLIYPQESGVIPGVFLNASTAWMSITLVGKNGTFGQSLVFATTNGGQTWTQAAIPTQQQQGSKLVFANSLDGWLFAGLLDPASSLSLYQTSDGGKTWNLLFDPSSSQAIAFKNISIVDVSFANDQIGLLTGIQNNDAGPEGSSSVVYRTTDGGQTWKQLPLHLQGVAGRPYDTLFEHPHFFNAKDAVFTAVFSTELRKSAMYTTVFTSYDAGATWTQISIQPTPRLCNKATPGGGYFEAQLLDLQHGWASCSVSGSVDYLLYSTDDGGAHWNQVGSVNGQGNLISARDLDFVSTRLIWHLGHPGQDSPEYVLYRSTDGGQTWTQIQTKFPDFIVKPQDRGSSNEMMTE